MILHLVTDRRRLSAGGADVASARRCLVEQARHAIEAGVDYVQVRERDLEAADLAAIVAEVIALARGSGTRILVNDRLDVAIACGASGVHLRSDSMAVWSARAIAPRGFVVGKSVHAIEDAVAAAEGADYLIAGTVWPTESKDAGHTVIGAAGLARIAAAVGVPVLAIGGVTLERLPEVARAGAAGAAGVGLFMAAAGAGAAGCRAETLGRIVRAARSTFDTRGSAS